MSLRRRISRDYTELRHELQPTTDSNRIALRENSTGRIIASCVMLAVIIILAAYGGVFALHEVRRHPEIGFTPIICGLVFALLVFIAALLALGIVRGVRAIRAPQKTVYKGHVTGTGIHGGSSRTSVRTHVVYLDSVMFEISKREMELIKEGMEAEIHCVIPGEVIDIRVRGENGTWSSVRDAARTGEKSSGLADIVKLIWHFIF